MVRILIGIGLMLGCTEWTVQAKGLSPVPSVPPVKTSPVVTSNASPVPTQNQAPKSPEKAIAKSTAVKTTPLLASSTLGKHPLSTAVARNTTPSFHGSQAASNGHLARLTAYWAGEGDYYTGHGHSSTGVRLHDGHCAVDPRIIPYGSVVTIPGVGKYLAVDTGSAVISREAAREAGHTPEERSALVIDIYFESRRDGEQFEANATKYASITWEAPNQANSMTSDVKDLIAESDWSKLRNKQL